MKEIMRYFTTYVPGIHGFLKKGIVRVGGRSNSETLKSFGLRELTRAPNFRKGLPHHLRKAHTEVSPIIDITPVSCIIIKLFYYTSCI